MLDNRYNFDELASSANLSYQEAMALKTFGAHNNPNYFAAYLCILISGYKALNQTFAKETTVATVTVTPSIYNTFINKDSGILKNLKMLDSVKKKSPAGQLGQLDDLGRIGMTSRLAGLKSTNPTAGPPNYLPPGCREILERTDNGFIKTMESVCNSIIGHTYLKSTSTMSFGGFSEVVHRISGAVQDFYDAMFDMYQTMQTMMAKAQMVVSAIAEKVQNFIVRSAFFQTYFAPWLALICAILSAVQTLIDDIAFFASLFKGSDNLYKMLNAVQNVVNIGNAAVDIAFHPITSGIPAAFPKEVKAYLDFVDNLGKIPQSYLGMFLKNFSGGKRYNNSAIATANAIINHYGIGAQLGELRPIMQSFGTAIPQTNWHRTNPPVFYNPTNFMPRHIPYGLRKKISREFNALQFDTNGRPVSFLDGTLNAVTNVFDLRSNFAYNKFKTDLGSSYNNLSAATAQAKLTIFNGFGFSSPNQEKA